MFIRLFYLCDYFLEGQRPIQAMFVEVGSIWRHFWRKMLQLSGEEYKNGFGLDTTIW